MGLNSKLHGLAATFGLAMCISLPAAAETQTRSVDDYDAVVFSVAGKLYLEQVDDPYVRLEGDGDDLEKIITEVEDGRLIIREDSSLWSSADSITAYVGIENLEMLSVNGSGDVEAETLETDELELSLNGSGEVQIERLQAQDVEVMLAGSGDIAIERLEGEDLEAMIAGSGRIDLAGAVESQDVVLSGSGDYEAAELACEDAGVVVSGSGDVLIYAEHELDVVISGSGTVSYLGDPSVSRVISGSGSVEPAGD